MQLREQLYGASHLPPEVEKRHYRAVAVPAFSDVWERHPELLPTSEDNNKERERKGGEIERLAFESMVVSAIDTTALPRPTLVSELRRIADLLQSLESH
jgi:hypothetical protein